MTIDDWCEILKDAAAIIDEQGGDPTYICVPAMYDCEKLRDAADLLGVIVQVVDVVDLDDDPKLVHTIH